MNEKKRESSTRIKMSGRACFLFTLSCLYWMTPSPAHAADYLIGSGCSISNVGYLTKLAKEYEKRTGVKVLVRGGGSAVGIEDLRQGKVDFAAACRSKISGDPEDISFIPVAWDALVFIVHPSNPIENITLSQVRSIYSGHKTRWNHVKHDDRVIKLFFSRPNKGLSGVEASLRELVLNGSGPVETEHTLFVASSGIAEQMVETTPGGFATTGYSSAKKREVKMLSVNGVTPTNRNIIRGKYPLKRPLYILIPRNPSPAVTNFVDFVLSSDGQRYIRSLNIITLLDLE